MAADGGPVVDGWVHEGRFHVVPPFGGVSMGKAIPTFPDYPLIVKIFVHMLKMFDFQTGFRS